MIAPSSVQLAKNAILSAYHTAVSIAYSNDCDMDEATQVGLAAAFRESINQLQQGSGIIECPDLLSIADSLDGFNGAL